MRQNVLYTCIVTIVVIRNIVIFGDKYSDIIYKICKLCTIDNNYTLYSYN